MILIPAIDLIDGKCVRLTQGNFDTTKVYNENPLAQAKIFEETGFTNLHIVDLDGAKSGSFRQLSIVEKIVKNTSLKVDFGGGIRSKQDVADILNIGVNQVDIGSLAVKNPDIFIEILKDFEASSIILSADCRDRMIASDGWNSIDQIDVIAFINSFIPYGLGYTVVTDIAKDGMLEGPSFKLYEDIIAQSKINLIASGGVSSISDLRALKAMGCHAAIIGKAYYEGNISASDFTKFISENNNQ